MDHPPDPIGQFYLMKIDQQSQPHLQQAQMRQYLSFIYRMECRLGLQFHDDRFIDNQIGPETAFKFNIVVNKRNRILLDDPKTTLVELISQTNSVGRFQ